MYKILINFKLNLSIELFYFSELKFSDVIMNNAIDILHKIEHFINNCDNYITGKWNIGNIDEVALLRVSYIYYLIISSYFYINAFILYFSIKIKFILVFRRNKKQC